MYDMDIKDRELPPSDFTREEVEEMYIDFKIRNGEIDNGNEYSND